MNLVFESDIASLRLLIVIKLTKILAEIKRMQSNYKTKTGQGKRHTQQRTYNNQNNTYQETNVNEKLGLY